MQIAQRRKPMVDAIIYIEDFMTFVGYVQQNYPELLVFEKGVPVIRGFARTPAVQNGSKVMVYARFYKEEVEQWEDMPYVEVLSRANYVDRNTVDEVYSIIFNDSEKLAKYDSVYDRTPIEIDDGEGGTVTHTPPERFGMLS